MAVMSFSGLSVDHTDDSCIISKRSVAKLYYPDEPDFYEPFVQNLQRRSPLIHRSYWLCMQAIEVTVRRFLEEQNDKHKLVINLGCGYDPLPFQFWHRHRALGRQATFVDIDYPHLMEKKKEYILASTLLQHYLPGTQLQKPADPCLIRHEDYVAIACDLRDTAALETVLRREFDLDRQEILFVAEASINCMDVEATDTLMGWAASFNNSRFCLLEQLLPRGSDRHIAQASIDRHIPLETPLRSVSEYLQLRNRQHRFRDVGWPLVHTQSLWELWTDPQYVTAEQRLQLNSVEPFDEWEAFALLGSLCFLSLARNTEENTKSTHLWNLDAHLLSHKDAGAIDTWHFPTHHLDKGKEEHESTRSTCTEEKVFTDEQKNGLAAEKTTMPKIELVRRLRITSENEFMEIVAGLEPCVLEGFDLGSCIHRWTPDYLEEKIGSDRSVVIHSCETDRMTFQTKNFAYVKQPFRDFIKGVCHGERSYLRSVSTVQPGKHPTLLERDFPGIAGDFQLPDALSPVKATLHSSPLRISGPLTLWLHYDVLANILCQVRGTKTLRLYPPSDATHLEFPPGGSSSNIDVFRHGQPLLAGTHPREAALGPGDVLFIPPMWSHGARPTGGLSVAVNVFFRNLEPKHYAVGRDVYGNRDLQAYESGRKDIERMVKAFSGMPAGIARFYLDRLAAELKSKSQEIGDE